MGGIFDELEEIETAVQADTKIDRAILDAVGVLNRNVIAIGKILFARDDNIDAALRDITALLTPPAPGPAVKLELTPGPPTEQP